MYDSYDYIMYDSYGNLTNQIIYTFRVPVSYAA